MTLRNVHGGQIRADHAGGSDRGAGATHAPSAWREVVRIAAKAVVEKWHAAYGATAPTEPLERHEREIAYALATLAWRTARERLRRSEASHGAIAPNEAAPVSAVGPPVSRVVAPTTGREAFLK